TLVELHGGTVQARSEGQGKGCEVQVELPAVIEKPAQAHEPARTEFGEKASRRKILVVEDNQDAQQMLKSLLEMWGHEVTVASDGNAGLDAICMHRPEIALVDIGLPVTDGYELARRVRHRDERKGLLLVALTGYGAP